MDVIDRALWYINSHSGEDISLAGVAAIAGISRHHLAHVFARVMGRSVMGYVRALRLSDAARSLADGAPDILSVALDAGYSSHEAFSRAFRDTFGMTPEEVRAQRSLANLELTEPLSLDKSRAKSLKSPRMADSTAMTIAGLKQTLTFENMAAISAIWQRFVPHIGHVPQESPGAAYGVCFNMTDSGMDYIAGVAVRAGADLPKGFVTVKVPAGRYAVFRHDGHISRVGDSWGAIWGGGLEAAGLKAAATPIFERYGPEFDGRTGEGGLELWVPIEGS